MNGKGNGLLFTRDFKGLPGGKLDHPFIARVSKNVGLSKADIKAFGTILDGDRAVPRGHDLVIEGVECRNLYFVKDGCAIRYRLLRNSKRQVVSVLLPGDIVGLLGSFFERAAYSVTAITNLAVNRCSLESYVQFCRERPQFALALSWIAVREAAMNAEHIVNLGRRTPVERLSHFLLDLQGRLHSVGRANDTSFTLPFSQHVMADVLGLSVPHLNKMMQQLRSSKLIADEDRHVSFVDVEALRELGHYQLREFAPIPKSNAASINHTVAAL